ncbi:MAG TPA: hypothetical protein V6D22_22645 [Candidatus Obscuribacterales bacterium]
MGAKDTPDLDKSLFVESLKQTGSAAGELLQEAYRHPTDAIEHVVKVATESAVAGALLSAVIPSRGPAALVATGLMMVPLGWSGYKKYEDAMAKAKDPESFNTQAHELARQWDSMVGDSVLGFAGGWGGAGLGQKVAMSETSLGRSSQAVQKAILKGENKALVGLAKAPEWMSTSGPTLGSPEAMSLAPMPRLSAKDTVLQGAVDNMAPSTAFAGAKADSLPNKPLKAWFALSDTTQNRVALAHGSATPKDWQMYYGDTHAHSHYSDGLGDPKDYFEQSKAGGKAFDTMTDHNHLDARMGVDPNDPRAEDQVGVPIIAAAPEEYQATRAAADAVTEEGKYVGLVGTELGTIGHYTPPGKGIIDTADGAAGLASPNDTLGILGKNDATSGHVHSDGEDGHSHEAPRPGETIKLRVTQPDGSVEENNYILPNDVVPPPKPIVPTAQIDGIINAGEPFSLRSAPPQPDGPRYIHDHRQSTGVNHSIVIDAPKLIVSVKNPDVIKKLPPGSVTYQDGNYKELFGIVQNMQASDGGILPMSLAHPNKQMRPIEYGRKSFDDDSQWIQTLDGNVRMIEIIKGEALNPNPTDVMKSADLSPENLAYYVDKGLHVGPVGGRDDHFHMPLGRPMGTGVLGQNLTKHELLEGMRNRRVSATTSRKLLQGFMTTEDGVPMGSILDQNAVHDLNLRMTVGGVVDPQAKYQATLFGDVNVGDGKLATKIQSLDLTGQDILKSNNQIQFDQVSHKLGNKSAWYVQLTRSDPQTQNTDYMWTAPLWIEPLAGTTHNIFARTLVGAGAQPLEQVLH